MVDITKHLTNKYYYISLLMEFEKAEEICANPTGIQGKIEFRIEDMIIITEDGTLIIIDGITGQMFVVSGPGLYGCCNHTGWSSPINIVWRGSTIWWTNNPGNTRGSGFNANEDGWINSGWFDTGISGGGGGTSSTIPNCQIPEYWSQIDPQIKKDYIRAFSSLVNEFEAITCTQPNLTPDEQEECISNEDLLCLGLDSDCLQIANGQLDVNNYTECMGAVLNRLPCLNEALNYINENNLNIRALLITVKFVAVTVVMH